MRVFPVLYMEAENESPKPVSFPLLLRCKIAKKDNVVLHSGLLT